MLRDFMGEGWCPTHGWTAYFRLDHGRVCGYCGIEATVAAVNEKKTSPPSRKARRRGRRRN